MIITIDKTPATKRPVSSFMPSENAALKPSNDQRKGIMITQGDSFETENSKMPKVKMVVGQGNPKVGAEG